MKSKIFFIFTLFYLLSSIALFSQSKLKFVKGEVFTLTHGKKYILSSLNLIINDTNTLFFSNVSDYMVVESEGDHVLIKGEDYYPNGFNLLNFENISSENISTGLFSKIFAALFKDEFNEKKKIDNLYITQFQGVTRSIFDNSINEYNIHLNYYSKIKWNGSKIEIISEDELVFKNEKSKSNSYLFDEKNINSLSVCNPCSVIIDNNNTGLIYAKTLDDNLERSLKDLDNNIASNIYPELSELLKVRLFIQNELYFNANYYIDLYDDNSMISEYLTSTRFNF